MTKLHCLVCNTYVSSSSPTGIGVTCPTCGADNWGVVSGGASNAADEDDDSGRG